MKVKQRKINDIPSADIAVNVRVYIQYVTYGLVAQWFRSRVLNNLLSVLKRE